MLTGYTINGAKQLGIERQVEIKTMLFLRATRASDSPCARVASPWIICPQTQWVACL